MIIPERKRGKKERRERNGIFLRTTPKSFQRESDSVGNISDLVKKEREKERERGRDKRCDIDS